MGHASNLAKTFIDVFHFHLKTDHNRANGQVFSAMENRNPVCMDSKDCKEQQLFNDFLKPEISPTPPEVLSPGYLTIWKAFGLLFRGVGRSRKEELFFLCSELKLITGF